MFIQFGSRDKPPPTSEAKGIGIDPFQGEISA